MLKCLHLQWFLYTEMKQLIQIIHHGRQRNADRPQTMLWLLIAWRFKEPGNQQPCYWSGYPVTLIFCSEFHGDTPLPQQSKGWHFKWCEIIEADNGLSSDWRQAITWTNDGLLLIETPGMNLSEIWIKIQQFSYKKIDLKMSAKRQPSCLGFNECTEWVSFQWGEYSSFKMMQSHDTSPCSCIHRKELG